MGVDRELPEPLLRSLGRGALLFGLSVAKGPFWNDKVPDKPSRKKGERLLAYKEALEKWENERRYINPVIMQMVDSRQVMYPIDVFPPPFVIETGKRTVRYIRETYGLTLEGKKDGDEVEWVEYWDKGERLFLANGQSVLDEDAQLNVGGFLPYKFVYSGLGQPAVSSMGGQAGGPAALIRGILHPVMQALKQEATMVSALDAIVQLHAYPQYVFEESGVNRIAWEDGPGGGVVVPDGYKLTLLEMPHALPDMYNRLNMLRKEIEDATFTGVIQGNPPPGVEAGYAIALLVSQARMKFGALIGNLERAKERILGDMGRLIEALDETVTVWAKTPGGNLEERIKAEDFKGHHEVYVTLSGVSPEEADRRGMLGLNYRKAGDLSQQTFWERFAMLPDATGERERILIERLLETPEIQKVLAQEALKAWADEEVLKALEEAEQVQTGQQGAVPGQLGPEMVGGGSGMPGLNVQPPGVPPRPAPPGGQGAAPVWQRRLQRLGGVAAQAQPIGGPREEP